MCALRWLSTQLDRIQEAQQIKRSPTYRDLDPKLNEIRLLHILPAKRGKRIECRLSHASIDDEQARYQALSYVWGAQLEQLRDVLNIRHIFVDDKVVAITRNLEVALRHIRDEQDEVVLWVDALCINQFNLAEKSSQISIMGKIYQRAYKVLAWLGQEDQHAKPAYQLIRTLTRLSYLTVSHSSMAGAKLTPQVFRDAGIEVSDLPWESLASLFRRPYWSRMWVIQELYHADSTGEGDLDRCVVGCADEWLPRRDFVNAWRLLVAASDSRDHYIINDMKAYQGDAMGLLEPIRTLQRHVELWAGVMFYALDIAREFHESGHKPTNFAKLLKATRNFEATDLRDKVYALLGMASEEFADFPIDYSLPRDEALKVFVKYVIEKHGDLAILEGNRAKVVDFRPSWVLDFYPLPHPGRAWSDNAHLFKASNGLPAQMKPNSGTDNILHLKGVQIGVICTSIGPFGWAIFKVEPKDRLAFEQRLLTEQKRLQDLPGSLDDAQKESLWRTLVLDQDSSIVRRPQYPAPDIFDRIYMTVVEGTPPPDDFEPSIEDADLRKQVFIRPFLSNVNACVQHRCIFVTDNGYIGAGPYDTQVGDVAVVLLGGSMCFVLRPKGHLYQLAGDAYVHGVMQGEMIQLDQAGNIRDCKDFGLC